MADRVGQQFGNYRLVALLGTGGYAEVYLGQHLRLNQQAAIKLLHAHLSESEAEHFQQEAQIIAQLVHPAIVRVFDYDVQDGVPFLVMDYAPNGSLRRRYPRGSLVPLPQIVSTVKQVADALQYAHEQKVIHRDIKPENMLLGRREEVLLSDFGIATVAHSTASLGTQPSVGTIVYMAPEQIEGHPRAASDQYALGVVVYEWLCGERPFEGSLTEVMVKHLSMPPPPLRERLPMLAAEVEQVVFKALAKEPKERFASVAAFAQALEQASQGIPTQIVLPPAELSLTPPMAATVYPAPGAPLAQAIPPTQAVPAADRPGAATELVTPEGQVTDEAPVADHAFPPTAPATPLPADVPPLPKPASAARRKGMARRTAGLLIGLVVLVVAGGILGSTSLLAHFGVLGARSTAAVVNPVRGGTWTDDLALDPDSFIPNSSTLTFSVMVDQALYLPLFYSDAQGLIHAGAASEIPTLQNGGISADVKTWTFHLRPGLVWSDGKPYDARDVDYTWRVWRNIFVVPQYGLITSADVSADHLTITFHLKQAYVPFLSLWVDGFQAPLPAHHFSGLTPSQIAKKFDVRNPQVVSGPFIMSESVPGDHYTLVRNPRYYRARQGLPYLDKVVFRVSANPDATLNDLQAGSIDSSWSLNWDFSKLPAYLRLRGYTLLTPPTSAGFEAMYFNFHNTVLASHLEVRQAIASAIDHQALIQMARHGFATPLCTDHGSFYHPGYQPGSGCPPFDPALANQLLDENGWVKGPDGVRARDGQRLEFEYSTTPYTWREDTEAIIQRNLSAIGIKLDIHNYFDRTFFGPFLREGKASPPTGAVAGRYDIAEFEDSFGYDPDDSSLLSCDQFPPNGINFGSYCNPALDALYRQELTTADAGARQGIFDQIHGIYLTDFPFIVLFGSPDIAMVRKGTHNYQISPVEGETVNIWEWWCDKGKC